MKKLVVYDTSRSETFNIGDLTATYIQLLGKDFPLSELASITGLSQKYLEEDDVNFYIDE